jgi:hypothetical protein
MRKMGVIVAGGLLGAICVGLVTVIVGAPVGVHLVQTHRMSDEIFGGLLLGLWWAEYTAPVGALVGMYIGALRAG